MHDPLLVRGRQPAGDLDGVVRGLPHRQRAAREPRAQRLALQQFLHDVGRPLVLAELVDGRDVRVVQPARGLRLLLEPAHAFGVLRERGRQHLDRDGPLELSVPRAADLAHASGAEEREDLVVV